jgi:hypothetical protein
MVKVVEYLFSNHRVLSSNASTVKKKVFEIFDKMCIRICGYSKY